MNKQFRYYLQLVLVVLDILMLNGVFLLVQFILKEHIADTEYRKYMELLGILNVSWLLLSFAGRTYAEHTIINFEKFTKRSIQTFIIWMVAVLFYLFLLRRFELSRSIIIAAFISFAIAIILNRFIYLGIYHHFRSKANFQNRVLIIGYNAVAKRLESYFDEEGYNSKLIGFTEDPKNVHELTRRPILAPIHDSIITAAQWDVQEIYSTITPEQHPDIYHMIAAAEKACIRFKMVPDLSVFVNRPVHIDYIRDMPVLSMRSEPLDDVGNRIKKRILDIMVSSLVIIFILSWLIPLLGLLILLESRGPIFFAQVRSGRNNKTFRCYKFRSMRVNNDSDKKQATKNDNRITRIGRFIRKTSLDEFPQFFNVLKGEMSLVGPRPHMVKHTDDYSKIVDQFMVRQFLKPGITGWAQINGFRGEITDENAIIMRVTNDLWYLENWNIWLDIRIMFLTVYKVFSGDDKAY